MGTSSRPFICAHPVIPGRNLSIPCKCRFSSSSVCTDSTGRGPTSDMSPLNTEKSWGNSSMLVFRKKLPSGVMYCSGLHRVSLVPRGINHHGSEFWREKWLTRSTHSFRPVNRRAFGIKIVIAAQGIKTTRQIRSAIEKSVSVHLIPEQSLPDLAWW